MTAPDTALPEPVAAADGLTVSGPYKYAGDLHPSFRIDAPDRIIATVFASDGDEATAEQLANRIASALSHPAALSGGDSEPVPRSIVTYSCGCVFRDLNVPCRNPECKICHDLPSRADALTTARPSYDTIIELVSGCVERMLRTGESHRMLARWISEGLTAALATAPEGTELDGRAKEKLKLWFFRDMSDEQRLKLFSLFGMPTDEIGKTHGYQSLALKHVLAALAGSSHP